MFPTVKLADQYADVQEGDLIQLEKGEEVRRGRVHPSNVAKKVLIMQGRTLDGYKQDNYTLHVIEKALPKLPVEPADGAVIKQSGRIPMYRHGRIWRYVSIPDTAFTWEEAIAFGGSEFTILYDGRS